MRNNNIKKAVIPAAGLGTRFLPATKALPKEMLPIVDKPAIQYIVEEAIESGIEDIIIVISSSKQAIKDHFERNDKLELNLFKQNKHELLKIAKDISSFDIKYVRQNQALGLGHAVWCARNFVGKEPFAVLLGDVITVDNSPCLKQLIQTYEQLQSSVIAVQTVDWANVSGYGVIDGEIVKDELYKVNRLVEKPKIDPPSNLAIIGRYILEPEIFDILEQFSPGQGGEIQLTDALQELLKQKDLYSQTFQGKLYDVGDKLGYLKAIVDFGLKHDTLQKGFYEYLKQTVLERDGSQCVKH
ncbi:UTP--glucose-1-phosphate uridylyltransferase GalU [Paenibacillus sediminis]|uniref:UTP--glucose-1-phosphate uridylyltransferase n=1 Tax=Paenibacillus sediminis TaxID=664909 RepID=A0ABS4H1V6_9BACL|nr:UTP--glucose-1-phosphate uridylyltransferase GalU [Paenibacillus sediminis]MBP1936247.1 UTP--glucose-1-phosphate uridylyltransferase [Paenibacillus sediminis]